MSPNKKVTVRRWLRFLVGGGINTACTFGIFLGLNCIIPYQSAYLIAYLLGVLFAYWFNVVVVFKVPLSWKGCFSYPLVYIIQYGLSALLLGLLVEFAKVNVIVAPLIVTVVMVPLSYILNRYVFSVSFDLRRYRLEIKKLSNSVLRKNNFLIKLWFDFVGFFSDNSKLKKQINPRQHYYNNVELISDTAWQILIAVGYFIIVIIWSMVINFHGAPDESTHFFLVEYIYHYKTMPEVVEPISFFTGDLSHHTWHPGIFWYYGLPFPHVIGAFITATIGSMVLPDSLLYLGVRAFNWVLAVFFVIALFRISRHIGLSKFNSASLTIIIAMIPQVAFIFAYFNSDAYGLTSVAWALCSLLAYCVSPTRIRAIVLGITIGLLMLAKLYFLPSLVFIGATLLIQSFVGLIKVPRHFIAMIFSCAVFSAPMLIFTYNHFGEVFGISGQLDFVEMHKLKRTEICYLLCEQGLIVWDNLLPWLVTSAKSYFSVTGWMAIYIADYYYLIALLLFSALIFLSLYLAIREWVVKKKFTYNYHLPLLMILGLYPSIILFSIIASQNGLPQPQGRYLFVTIPFLAYLIALVAKILEEYGINNVE